MERLDNGDTAGFEQVLHVLGTTAPTEGASTTLDVNILSARYYNATRKTDSAIHCANMAIDELISRKDSLSAHSLSLAADMKLCIATALWQRRDYEQALWHAEQGIDYARRAVAPANIIDLTLLKAVVLRDNHSNSYCLAELRTAELILDTACEASIGALKRTQQLSEAAGIAIDLCHIGSASRLLTKASEYYDKLPDRTKIIYLKQLMRLDILMGENDKATTVLSRLEMLMGKTGYRQCEQSVNAFQGLVRSRMGDREWAMLHLRRIPTSATVDNEALVVAMLAHAEILTADGKTDEARAILNDSVTRERCATPFLWVLSNDSRLAYCTKVGNLSKALEIQTQERSRLANLHNDLFSYDDYQRWMELTAAFTARQDALLAEQDAAGTRRCVMSLIIIAILSAVAAIILCKYRTLRRKNRESELSAQERLDYEKRINNLQKQADMLEVTNARITESISYAEQIQHAITPSPEKLNTYPISGSFVFFSPLDVVSGDFFWYTSIGNTLIVCCADCTGHGVPGALLSMMSATILNDICSHLKEENVDPSDILEKLDYNIIENLAHNREQGAKDGLDVTLAAIDLATHRVKVASARRPFIVVMNKMPMTIRGTKRSIGDLEPIVRQRRFETTTLDMRKGDKIYMFSDGYSDQFGGQKGEKMKNSMVERFISNICNDDMDQQSLAIQEMFIQWKGDYPQTDDVTFVGLSI